MDESICGTVTYTPIFTLVSAISYNSVDNVIEVYTLQESLKGSSTLIRIVGIINSGASENITFTLTF